ncbi:hypothetical protein P171DRAFT_430873, partial [Karstenula rhodostoma CBS 690.94]
FTPATTPHPCTQCAQSFGTAASLAAHRAALDHTHLSTCTSCGLRFAAKSAWSRHGKACGRGEATAKTYAKAKAKTYAKANVEAKVKAKVWLAWLVGGLV